MNDTLATKLRFAPSPTGLMHLGNSRTALFSALFAKAHQGIFLLRVEDTDRARSTLEFTEQLQQDLHWLGLDWQEGPGHDLGHGPYFQSERLSIYQAYYQTLADKGYSYPCFCSEEMLTITRKVQLSAGQPPRYPGTCKSLTPAEIEQKIAAGEKPAIRFCMPKDVMIQFNDIVKGPQSFKSDDIGDFIICRQDGTPPFMYCNAIDDALMGVTHVMRGEDHLTNTPRQIIILQALGLRIPEYGHFALIVGQDGSKLSKRHGARSIFELRQEGFLAIAIVNYLARLGHSYEDLGFVDFELLAKHFEVKRLSKSPAKFDPEQLYFWQKEAVMHLDNDSFWQWAGIAVHSVVPPELSQAFVEAVKGNCVFPKDVLEWANRCFDERLDFIDEQLLLLKQAGAAFFAKAIEAANRFGADYQKICQYLTESLQVKGKALFQPLRLALTQALHGPEMVKLVPLMGEEQIIRRFHEAQRLCEHG